MKLFCNLVTNLLGVHISVLLWHVWNECCWFVQGTDDDESFLSGGSDVGSPRPSTPRGVSTPGRLPTIKEGAALSPLRPQLVRHSVTRTVQRIVRSIQFVKIMLHCRVYPAGFLILIYGIAIHIPSKSNKRKTYV